MRQILTLLLVLACAVASAQTFTYHSSASGLAILDQKEKKWKLMESITTDVKITWKGPILTIYGPAGPSVFKIKGDAIIKEYPTKVEYNMNEVTNWEGTPCTIRVTIPNDDPVAFFLIRYRATGAWYKAKLVSHTDAN